MSFKVVLLLFGAFYGSAFGFEIPLAYQQIVGPRIFEKEINTSVECVRGFLNDGFPKYNIPSLNPLNIDNITLNLDNLNLSFVSGEIHIDNGVVTDIPTFVMTKILGSFILIPPTYTVDFSLHYDQVVANSNYKFNITILDTNVWGEGTILSGVENLNAAGHVKALVDLGGVQITEFDAPITLEKYNFKITGLFGDEEYSQHLSELISEKVPEYINGHPEIFSEFVGPLFMVIVNALVNDDVGVGIIKDIIQECIIDVLFPPPQ